MKPESSPDTAAGTGAIVGRPIGLAARFAALPTAVQGLVYAVLSGMLFVCLNVVLRTLSMQLHPMQAQFLRYLFAVVVMVPLVARSGLRAYVPARMGPQFTRGAVHTVALLFWFAALPRIPMASTTAIGFTTPLFVMLGAALFLREAMRWERWLAAGIGFAGVLIVVGPQLQGTGGYYNLLMLISSPLFAASYLLTKAMTRNDRAEVIVLWQAISISVFSLPLAWGVWQEPTTSQWLGFVLAGLLGVGGHYALTRALAVADASASQSVKFLDLVTASLLGWLVFAEVPDRYTLIGGVVICLSTLWIALRESRRRI